MTHQERQATLGSGECQAEDLNSALFIRSNYLLSLTPRHYQKEICDKAIRENVIIYLGTGLGKTFIIVLFLRSPIIACQIRQGRKVVFLAPTQDLTKQQAKYIHDHVPYSVRVYCGRTCSGLGTHIDHWSLQTWQQEMSTIDIMVMTPQIFCSAISTGLLKWEKFTAIIFDECHHAVSSGKESKHMYARLLEHFYLYYKDKPELIQPRVIGLTASLINNLPKDPSAIIKGIEQLESKLKGRCITDIQVQESKPDIVIMSFTNVGTFATDPLYSILMRFAAEMKKALGLKDHKKLKHSLPERLSELEKQTLTFYNRLKLASIGISIKPTSIPKVLVHLAGIRSRCGLWQFRAVTNRLISAIELHAISTSVNSELKYIYATFNKLLKLLVEHLSTFMQDSEPVELIRFTQPKLISLLEILKSEYYRVQDSRELKSTFSCVIFVQSRLEVVTLNLWLQRVSAAIPEYKFIKPDYAVGLASAASSKYSCITKRKSVEQSKMLENFRCGNLNVLVTTSVLEEGIDLPICSTVIRYDPAMTFRVYVQSRGRARQKISSYITMCEEKDSLVTCNHLTKLNDFEQRVKDHFDGKNIASELLSSHLNVAELQHQAENPYAGCGQDIVSYSADDFFHHPEGDIIIFPSEARILLNMYQSCIRKRTPFTDPIQIERVQLKNSYYQTFIHMPPECPIKEPIKGYVKLTPELSDNSAYVRTLKKLFELGELDEHAIPIRSRADDVLKLLQSTGLAPVEKELDPRTAGRETLVENRLMYEVLSRLGQKTRFMSEGYMERKYKLISLRFTPKDNCVREDVGHLFVKTKFGIIVDDSLGTEFIPQVLNGHYGEFEVMSETLASELKITSQGDHNSYLNFTHWLLTSCLSLGRIPKKSFKYKCLFYLCLLDTSGQPDFESMRFSTLPKRTTNFATGHIVKLRSIYDQHDARNHTKRGQLMMVMKIHNDMSPNSIVPGRKITFAELTVNNYGQNFAPDPNQPVIELMTLSKKYAETRKGKTIESGYTSRSVMYLEQFLEIFSPHPEMVLQAFNLPQILFKLYHLEIASELNRQFASETSALRSKFYDHVQQPEPERIQSQNSLAESHEENSSHTNDEDLQQVGSIAGPAFNINIDDSQCEVAKCTDEDDNENSSDSQDFDDDDLNSDVSSSDYDLEEMNADINHTNMLRRSALDFRDKDKSMEKWDLSEYSPEDPKPFAYSFKQHFIPEPQMPLDSSYLSFVEKLNHLETLKSDIISLLLNMKARILCEEDYLGEEEQLKMRPYKVDTTVEPPILFSFKPTPLIAVPPALGLVEALTRRRAGESYSLEALENIGDSYLKYCVSVMLFKVLQDSDEGALTIARTIQVSNKRFAYLIRQKGLASYAISNRFSGKNLADMLVTNSPGCKNLMREKDIADLFESLVGAKLVYEGELEAIMAIQWLGIDIIRDDMFTSLSTEAVRFSKCPTALAGTSLNKDLGNYFEAYKVKLEKLEDIISYTFKDKSFLIQALTHPSASVKCTNSYERLEFLGDAILDYLITVTLFKVGSFRDPGQLSSSRSQLVNNMSFAKMALKINLDLFLAYGNHELFQNLSLVKTTLSEDPDMNFFDSEQFDQVTKLLGDLFESLAGAIYLDSGCSLEQVWRICYPLMKDFIEGEIQNPSKNLTSVLYETFPGDKRISFENLKSKSNQNVHIVKCHIKGYKSFEGSGLTLRQAKRRAISAAVKSLPNGQD